jgi:hypothetical protein
MASQVPAAKALDLPGEQTRHFLGLVQVRTADLRFATYLIAAPPPQKQKPVRANGPASSHVGERIVLRGPRNVEAGPEGPASSLL